MRRLPEHAGEESDVTSPKSMGGHDQGGRQKACDAKEQKVDEWHYILLFKHENVPGQSERRDVTVEQPSPEACSQLP
jgi:hypothetical protein